MTPFMAMVVTKILITGVSYSDLGAEALHAVGVSTPDANVSVLWLLMQTGIEYRLV